MSFLDTVCGGPAERTQECLFFVLAADFTLRRALRRADLHPARPPLDCSPVYSSSQVEIIYFEFGISVWIPAKKKKVPLVCRLEEWKHEPPLSTWFSVRIIPALAHVRAEAFLRIIISKTRTIISQQER